MLEKLKTINLDTVPEMFARAGIKPCRGIMCSCVMAAALHPVKFENVSDAEAEGFDPEYVYGVMDGWDCDGYFHFWPVDKNGLKYRLGLSHGTAARRIMNPE